MLCMVLYYSVEHNNPVHSNENPDLPPRMFKVWKALPVCVAAKKKPNLPVCLLRRSCLRKLKSSKHVITHHPNHTNQTLQQMFDLLLTLDDGVVGHCLQAPSIIIKRQVPHPWVQVLDESSLMDSDRMIQTGPWLRFAGTPMLFSDKPAAIQ